MVGVPQNDRSVEIMEILGDHSFYRTDCSHRHEDGGFDDPMFQFEAAASSFATFSKHFEHVGPLFTEYFCQVAIR